MAAILRISRRPAHGADVGLNDVGARHLQQPVELEPGIEAFTGGKRDLQRCLQAAPGLEVLGPHRLLVEQRVKRRQGVAELNRLPGFEQLRMRVERELEPVPACVHQCRDPLRRCPDHRAPRVRMQIDSVWRELERGEPEFRIHRQAMVVNGFRLRGAVDAEIDTHPIPHMAAEKEIHGNPEGLRGDVPERVVDGGYGGKPERSRREPALLQQLQDQALDPPWILSLDLQEQIVQEWRERTIRTVVVALAPAGNSLVRIDRDDDPRPVAVAGHVCPKSGDLHGSASEMRLRNAGCPEAGDGKEVAGHGTGFGASSDRGHE